MKNTELSKKAQKEFQEVNELSVESLDFSELGKVVGGNKPTQDTGCKGVFNGHCGGGTGE